MARKEKRADEVHPHAGGECADGSPNSPNRCGSPPRGWGMLLLHPQIPLRRRFTPTRVGNAHGRGWDIVGRKVHPHAGGECFPAIPSTCPYSGSPPRGWGMLRRDLPRLLRRRFTPTRVGNALADILHQHVHRFTPTRVGNASTNQFNHRQFTVHPHAGGECHRLIDHQPLHPGSPPRGWGMRSTAAGGVLTDRFTPTRVGNAQLTGAIRHSASVHPHAGGECCAIVNATHLLLRFTPTRVGNA